MKTSKFLFAGPSRLSVTTLFTLALLSSESAVFAQSNVPQDNAIETQTAASTSRLTFPAVSAKSSQPYLGPAAAARTPVETGESTSALLGTLPDAPGAVATLPEAEALAATSSDPYPPGPDARIHRSAYPAPRVAPTYNRYIEPFETAQHLTKTQTLIFGFHQSVSPYFLLTILAASGYEQARNSAPNYGTNIGSYGERLGAAAIRDTSQSVFSDSLMAPLLHQDPRYYIRGNQHNAFERTAYAVSRVVVTKSSDDGRLMPNYSQIAGYAEAAALTNAYYPDVNVGVEQTAKSLGGSLLGLAVSNVVREFLPDILHLTHLERFE